MNNYIENIFSDARTAATSCLPQVKDFDLQVSFAAGKNHIQFHFKLYSHVVCN
jgi:hypothetical protein